ncbi:hypothetical protein CsatA_019322 [Cannabis sativa]
MLDYAAYTELKVSEMASLFQVDPIAILTANAIDISYPNVENHILPSQLFLKVPLPVLASSYHQSRLRQNPPR